MATPSAAARASLQPPANTDASSAITQTPLATRPPLSPPTHHEASRVSRTSRPVFFRHPGYPDAYNILLALPAADGPTGGIHHETARVACSIIAGNRWDGFLATDARGTRVDADPDHVLVGENYYFFVPDTPDYPVVPGFSEWRFPHRNLPPSWAAAAASLDADADADTAQEPSGRALSNLSAMLAIRDGSCRMSACEEGCQIAHIVPQQQDTWFHSNSMYMYTAQYRRPDAAIHDSRNVLLLRADLHAAFDQMKFVFVPKPSPPGKAWCPFAIHILDPLAHELRRVYHNVPLQLPLGVATEFLLARFAWAVFPFVDEFLRQPLERRLLLASHGNEAVTLPPEKCISFTSRAARSRSVSPKKRGRPTNDIPDESERPTKHARLKRAASPASTVLPPVGPSASTPGASFGDSQTSVSDAELDRLFQEHLEKERMRSDPEDIWKAELEWLEEARKRPLGQEELPRFWEAQGFDIAYEEKVVGEE